jgi:hypothetical protein
MFDKDQIGSDEFMGRIILPTSQFSNNAEQWITLEQGDSKEESREIFVLSLQRSNQVTIPTIWFPFGSYHYFSTWKNILKQVNNRKRHQLRAVPQYYGFKFLTGIGNAF